MPSLNELLDACDHGDDTAIDRLGWREVIEALRMWPRRLGWDDLKSYAIALADEDPEAIVATTRQMAGNEYRPSPSALFIAVHTRPDPTPHPRELRGRPDITPTALQAVRLAAAAGEPICDCHPRSPQMTIDRDGVLRCPDCGGLEVGQYETALETALENESAETAQ